MSLMKVALVQSSAGRDVERNLRRVRELSEQIGSVDLIALPEVFAIRGTDADYRHTAEPLDGRVARSCATLAREKRANVLAGSLLERDGDRVFNTCVLFDRNGSIKTRYRKIHLFEARLPDGTLIREANAYTAGSEPSLADVASWRVGLSICYDLRFPELFRLYSAAGAQLLCVPANFTQNTGKDHWETLLRARAIENQCFVIAPNQCGANAVTGVMSYGHSMAVGPWGEVLREAGDEETVLTVELDPAELHAVRARVPALEHRVLDQ